MDLYINQPAQRAQMLVADLTKGEFSLMIKGHKARTQMSKKPPLFPDNPEWQKVPSGEAGIFNLMTAVRFELIKIVSSL